MGALLQDGQMLEGTSYRVVREIGAGGMGVVYEVEHVRLGKRYVAKVLNDEMRDERGSVERMQREATVLAKLAHPNVVQVHDFGSTRDGIPYFVMDKLEGIDLRRCMRERGVDRRQALTIARDVLCALDYVHGRGVIHRDIKPENVFLADEVQGTVTKVLDFGIVRVFGSEPLAGPEPLTRTGGFIGTLRYAAPEHLEGRPIGPAADVYAVGLIVFELFAGRGPFDGEEGLGVGRCLERAPRLRAFASVTPALDALIARVLERDEALRPSAAELAEALSTPGLADAPPPRVSDATEPPPPTETAAGIASTAAVSRASTSSPQRPEDDADRHVLAEIDDLLANLGTPPPAASKLRPTR